LGLLTNGAALPWADVPEWPLPEFLRNVGAELARGERLSSLFGVPEGEALAPRRRAGVRCRQHAGRGPQPPFAGSVPALTRHHAQAHLFEREIWEQHGVVPRTIRG